MASDEVTLIMRVKVGGQVSEVRMTRPLSLSGDRRKHRAQLRALGTEAVAAATAVLGDQFGTAN